MRYLKYYSEYERMNEFNEISYDTILDRIQGTNGGCSLPALIKTYKDSAQLMTVLDELTNSGQVELDGGKYKFVKD